jgi:hypothetical protein
MVQSIEFAPAVRRQPFQLGKQVTSICLDVQARFMPNGIAIMIRVALPISAPT